MWFVDEFIVFLQVYINLSIICHFISSPYFLCHIWAQVFSQNEESGHNPQQQVIEKKR